MSLVIHSRPSQHFNERRHGEKPWAIIIHALGGKHFKYAMNRLSRPELELSAHYVVHKDGTVFELVSPELRAWHAGQSGWYGRVEMNSASIGIELDHRNGEAFSLPQIKSLMLLCDRLMARYHILPEHVLGHSDIAPHRKNDPGPLFPWAVLAHEGLAFLPKPRLHHVPAAVSALEQEAALVALLGEAGYPTYAFDATTPAPSTSQLVSAFQRHYVPEVFKGPKSTQGIACEETCARLAALADHNKSLKETHQKIYPHLQRKKELNAP